MPTLLLDHVGRKSGTSFTCRCCTSATATTSSSWRRQGGRPEHPQWYRNLVADPDTHVQIGARAEGGARRRSPMPRERPLWPKLVDAYADFDTYQSWTEREIPVFVLKPR